MMHNFGHKSQKELNPKEQEKVIVIANQLIDNGYITYEDIVWNRVLKIATTVI